ncbi:MAG: folate-binding protein [Rickettsia sp.]|nr:folate-binding protein [Rickettsia sp.]
MYEILNNLEVIKISGENCLNFLQRFTTNDLKNQNFSYNYFLDSKGRYLYDSFLYRIPSDKNEKFIILINKSQINDLIEHLKFFKLKEKIQIENISSSYILLYSNKIIYDKNIIFSIKDPRYIGLGYISMIFKDNIELLEFNFTKNLYLKDKYNFAIPDGFSDLIHKKSIILEYGALQLNALNRNKGCYLGQELISRTLNQGIVRKNIYKITLNKEIDKTLLPYNLFIGELKIGHITSCYQKLAIAIINIDKIPYENKNSFRISNSNFQCKLEHAIWYKN